MSSMRSTPRRRLIRNRGQEDALSDLLGDFPERTIADRWQPSADVYETEDTVVVRLELPGVSSAEVRVNADQDFVRVSGVRRSPEGDAIRRLHQAEIAFGPFDRSIQIATPFDRELVTARLEDGVLEVRVPKQGRTARRVEVNPE